MENEMDSCDCCGMHDTAGLGPDGSRWTRLSLVHLNPVTVTCLMQSDIASRDKLLIMTLATLSLVHLQVLSPNVNTFADLP
jgi:hypothetical protein